MRRFTPLLLLFLVLTLPVGGRAADARPTPPADAATMLDRGLELYRSGHPDQALPVLRGFVIRYADDPGVREASLVLARIFLDQDRPREALLYLQRLDAGAQAPEVRLLRGLALTAAGDNQAGREALLTID
ncbi:MAG TPA: tetratricopeptide repeat protein, partial [Gammaproteobacteria bacterium]|nr:tetratricopeptide repeat protein [Gammaproteobacteria bacterium]